MCQPSGYRSARKRGRSFTQLRKPGQTFDDVIRELVDSAAEKRLVEETERIVRRGRFVPLSEIKP